SVGHRGQHVPAIFGTGQLNLGNAREVLSERIGILLGLHTEPVQVDLLVKIQIGVRALAASRIARVVESRVIRVPGDGAAGSAAVDAWNELFERLTRGNLVNVYVPRLASPFR